MTGMMENWNEGMMGNYRISVILNFIIITNLPNYSKWPYRKTHCSRIPALHHSDGAKPLI